MKFPMRFQNNVFMYRMSLAGFANEIQNQDCWNMTSSNIIRIMESCNEGDAPWTLYVVVQDVFGIQQMNAAHERGTQLSGDNLHLTFSSFVSLPLSML